MERKFLEGLGLEKDVIDKVMAENGKDINAEKAKTTAVNEELTKAKEESKTAQETIKDLKKNNANNEALQAKVTEYETKTKNLEAEYKEKIKNMTLDGAISKALTGANAKHSDLLSSKIDRTKLQINDDGSVTGLNEQVEGLKTNYKDLFETVLKGKEPDNKGNPTPEPGTEINSLGSALADYYK